MPTRLDHFDHHSYRKTLLKQRLICQRLPDPAYRAVTPSALTFNLSLEPAYPFNLSLFADKLSDDQIVNGRVSLKLQDYTLYIESDRERYEISRRQSAGGILQITGVAKFRIARVKVPMIKDNGYMS
jgi:hypothetical protein